MNEALLTIVIITCILLMLGGVVLSLLNLPGVWLIFLAYLITALTSGFELIPLWVLLVILVITVLSTFVDNIILVLSTKYIGGGKWGVWGAVIGALLAIFAGNLILSAVAPFVGATLFELVFAKRPFKLAIKAGFGTLMGMIVSVFMKFFINIGFILFWILLVTNG